MRTLSIIASFLLLLTTHAFAEDAKKPVVEAEAAEPPAPAATAAAAISHVPLNEVLVGAAPLVFQVRDPQLAGEISVHVIRAGHAELLVVAQRRGAGYEALIPEAAVVPPGFSYFVTEHMRDGSERPVFAAAGAAHPVRVTRPQELEDELAALAVRGGERSTLLLAGDGVDYGDRQLGPSQSKVHDRYYRIEAGYSYSFLTRIEAIRLSLVRVRGQAALWDGTAATRVTPTAPGIDYGRAEVTFRGNDELRLRAAVLLGASQRGFEYGGGAALTLGDPRAMNLDLGVESMTTLGTTGHLRLGFLAQERVPMGATVEVSSFPVGDDAGVRLLYDIGYRFGPVTELTVRAGYQGRTSVTGGPSIGATFNYGF